MDIFKSTFDQRMQISPYQAQTIANTILGRAPGCNVLVFGVGHDSKLWSSLNATGETHFVESSAEWIDAVRKDHAALSISLLPPSNLTVANSATLSVSDLSRYPVPTNLAAKKWDVILVDGPGGYSPSDPGRARTIYWASLLASPDTHVFIDDYDRPLERHFTDMLFRDRGTQRVVLTNSDYLPYRKMLWSVGSPIDGGNQSPVVLSVATGDYAEQWRFCIDSQYSYARRHNYEYRCIDPSGSQLHPKWAKLEATIKILEQGRDVLLIDADAEITKQCPPFAQLTKQHAGSDIYFVRGISGRPNSGVLILRGGSNSAATAFLAECLDRRTEKVPLEDFVTPDGENGHVIWILKEEPFKTASIEIDRAWNWSIPENADRAFIRHYTNHLRDWLRENPLGSGPRQPAQ
ncbi:uncharacterized plant-specific domain [Afipia felis]|nr:hypothetical protein HMPREF9697_00769 [Afipia felis ATCC 53690]SUU76951.1 uncharacterized plant-specific domain [Afipia felis]